jgi:hypothetical protein
MFDAFYNHFPIVYSDTSTYLASGFQLETPMDRPITYGLFLRLTSLNGVSLWLTIFFQALIVSFLIFKLMKRLLNEKIYLKAFFITIIFLSLFTGLSWTVCQLIPDIFTSVGLLTCVLLLWGRFNKQENIFLFFLFFLSVAMHMSHLLLFGLLLLIVVLLRKRLLPLQDFPKRNIQLTLLFILTGTSILTMGAALSKSKHIFFMGAMAEHGILKQYLDESCSTHAYKLCAYKDSLPEKAYQFVWEDDSPLQKIGTWSDVKPEFSEIISATLTQPKYIKLHIAASLSATVDQLMKFGINDGNGSFLHGTRLHERISLYCPHDISAYNSSRQSRNELGFTAPWNIAFTIITLLGLLVLVIIPGGLRHAFTTTGGNIIFVVFVAILLNAWDCGTFANAIDRLGCKMIWLLTFMATITILKYVWRNEKN